MAMKRCPVCGEKYSDTYKNCPFCEEEEALRRGRKVRRSGGKRSADRGQINLLTPTLVVLILIMAALLCYLLFGDQFQKKAGQQAEDPPAEDVTPEEPVTGGEEPPTQPGTVTMPESPEEGSNGEETHSAGNTSYEAALALPDGLTLSTEDFTLKTLGETHTISVSGGSGSYTWLSEDDGVASVDSSGKVTAVSGGTVNVVVTDGSKKGVCIVRCNVTGSASAAPSGGSGSALKAGAAVVVNGGNGVRVRSGPSTEYDVLATVPNGASVKVVESAGGGWYHITFSGVGGASTDGYMKGDFLANA